MGNLPPDNKAIKTEMRERLQAEIDALSIEYISSSNEGIYSNIITLNEYSKARNIMLYYSVKREIDTVMLAKAALADGKTVAFPTCLKGGIMNAHIVNDLSELKPAMLGIPAPPETAPIIKPGELELIIVPAFRYDRAGYRIGYGGGYYDRYLSGLSAFTVGVARKRLMKDDLLPFEPHDIPVNCVVTEEAILYIT